MSARHWKWLRTDVVLAVHDMQLAEHGGPSGVRDMGLLEFALARPQNALVYGQPSAAPLAASYGSGISRNHPFIDGNKRAGFVAMELFLNINGFELLASDVDCVLTMQNVASGDLSEADFANWIEQGLTEVDPSH